MLKIDVRDCNKYMQYKPEEGDSEQVVTEIEEKDKELLEKNKFYLKLR